MFFNKTLLLIICAIHALRMFGLFSILPILSIYTNLMQHSSIMLSSIALGSYGFTQFIFQLILGSLSDKYGRKKIILLGLISFFFGSIIAYLSNTIYFLILGRILQGSGAIGSVLNAVVIDNFKKYIVQAFTFVGITIFIAFILAMLIGPYINEIYGIHMLFFIMIITSLVCIFLILISNINNVKNNHKIFKYKFLKQNFKFYFVSFVLHFVLTSSFIIIPRILNNNFYIKSQNFYIITILISLLIAIFFIKRKNKNVKNIFILSLFNNAIIQMLLQFFYFNYYILFILFILYFTSFIIIESYLPFLLSKNSTLYNRGIVMGISSSIQYLGIFLGGFIGELIIYQYNIIFIFNSLLSFLCIYIYCKNNNY